MLSNQYYVFGNEVEYILENYNKWVILDIRDKFGFFSDIKSIKQVNPDIASAIALIKRLIITIGKIYIFSSVVLAIIQGLDGNIDFIISIIVAVLYFSIGYYYLKI